MFGVAHIDNFTCNPAVSTQHYRVFSRKFPIIINLSFRFNIQEFQEEELHVILELVIAVADQIYLREFFFL